MDVVEQYGAGAPDAWQRLWSYRGFLTFLSK